MNFLDLFILVVLGASAYLSARKGLVAGLVDIVALVVALALGSMLYKPVAAAVGALTGLPDAISGLLGFLAVALGTVLGLGHLLLRWLDRYRPSKALDWTGGALSGLAGGAVLAGLLVLVVGVGSGAAAVKQSALAPSLMSVVPRLHETMERAGLPLPKLVYLHKHPEPEFRGVRQGLNFLQINFTRLGGSTCIACGGRVRFLGYQFKQGSLLSPKFECTTCGRTSDGCLTYEGFHAIYDRCAIEIARHVDGLDCGVWTNGTWVKPKGRCPVCGRSVEGAPTD